MCALFVQEAGKSCSGTNFERKLDMIELFDALYPILEALLTVQSQEVKLYVFFPSWIFYMFFPSGIFYMFYPIPYHVLP